MDAYDIFKKLTKGLTFKQKVLGLKNEATQKPKELLKTEPDFNKKVVKNEQDFEENSDQSENDQLTASECSDNDLELVEGVKVGKKREKKKKKERTEDLQKKLEIEEQNRFRNEHGIKVVGRHVAAALSSFTSLTERYGVSDQLVDVVLRCGYSEPTPVQRQAIPCMLEDRQILACAPTGSGKTAAFLLPVIHTLGLPQGGPRALVLCPTRELAQQTYREALRLTEPTELRVSVIRSLKESKVKEREATFRKSDIVISTPNRLCYLLNQDKVNISLDKVRWLIIDEADKLFEGSAEQQSDFRQQLEQIMSASENKQRRVAMFSATHTPNVAKWCRRHLRGVINITVGHRNAASELVDQELLFCGSEAGKLVAFRQIVQGGLKPPVLVFVQSKERAKELFKELIYDGINVDVIHADRTQAQRDNVVRSFRVGRIWVLICTELMGRGIDFRGVNLVINYDFPPNAIAYVHRVGRAGRAGQKGKAITFFTEDDFANLRSIASVIKSSGCPVPEFMLKLKQNPNRRKALAKKAIRRDHISTVVQRPSKRKIEEDKDSSKQSKDMGKGTDMVKNGKRRKLRKITPKKPGDKSSLSNTKVVKGKPNKVGKNMNIKKKGKKIRHKVKSV